MMADKPEINEDVTNKGGDIVSTTDNVAENEFYFEDKSFEKEMEPHEVEDFTAYELGSEEDPVAEEEKNSHSLIHTLTKTLTELRLPKNKKKKKKHERRGKSAIDELSVESTAAEAPAHMYEADDAESEISSVAEAENVIPEETVPDVQEVAEVDDSIAEGKADELPGELLDEVYKLIPDAAIFEEAANDTSDDSEINDFVKNEEAEPEIAKDEKTEKSSKKDKKKSDKNDTEAAVSAEEVTAAAAATASEAVKPKNLRKTEKVKKEKVSKTETDKKSKGGKQQNKKSDTVKSSARNEINIAKIIIVPVAISIVVAFLLSFVNLKTVDIIEDNTNKAMAASIEKIFEREVECRLYSEDSEQKVYIVYNGTNLYGACIDLTTTGYGGAMEMLIGLDADNAVLNIEFVTMSETPGLGAKVKQPDFKDQFKGKNTPVSLGTDVDAITGATISSTAVTNAVNKVLASGINLYNIADELGMTVLLPAQWDGAQETAVSEETTAVPETTAPETTPQTEPQADETKIADNNITGGNTNVDAAQNKTNVTKNPEVTQTVVCQHTMSAAVDVPATCTSPAKSVRTCTKCKYEEITPAGTELAPHTPAEAVIEGTDSVVNCVICGTEISRTPVAVVTDAPATTAPIV